MITLAEEVDRLASFIEFGRRYQFVAEKKEPRGQDIWVASANKKKRHYIVWDVYIVLDDARTVPFRDHVWIANRAIRDLPDNCLFLFEATPKLYKRVNNEVGLGLVRVSNIELQTF